MTTKTKTAERTTKTAAKAKKITKQVVQKISKSEHKKMICDAKIEKRDARIKKLFETGKYTYQAIADKVGMSKSRIWFIING